MSEPLEDGYPCKIEVLAKFSYPARLGICKFDDPGGEVMFQAMMLSYLDYITYGRCPAFWDALEDRILKESAVYTT